VLSFRLANRNQTDNIFCRKNTFFSETKHFFFQKKHFSPKKNIFLRKNNIFFRKKTFFSEKTTFFSDKKHFFPASESDCPIHLISFRSFRSRAHRNRYHCVIVSAGKPRPDTNVFHSNTQHPITIVVTRKTQFSLDSNTCKLKFMLGPKMTRG